MADAEPLLLRAVAWPEVGPGDDLVGLLCTIDDLLDGDVLVVTSKVVAKAEGRVEPVPRDLAARGETRRVVARRGRTVIAETAHGLVLAAAGVDASNTAPGTSVLLPLEPDASARRLRDGVYARLGVNVAVLVSDTAGRAWRAGQTDLAIGCAGLPPYDDLAGTLDTHGNELLVTAPAIADELAAAADLVKGKTTGCPVAVVRGVRRLVLPPGEHGPGARALVRPADEDLFGLGAREAAVAAALRDDPVALSRFPRRTAADADPFEGLLDGLAAERRADATSLVRAEIARDACPASPTAPGWTLHVAVPWRADAPSLVGVGRLLERADVIAAAHRLHRHDHGLDRDVDLPAGGGGWRTVACVCWELPQ